MKLYAVHKDGKLYKASYDQNTPFYSTEKGAMAAIKSQTNRRNAPRLLNNEKDIQDYLNNEKKRYDIYEYTLTDEKLIYKGDFLI